MIPVLMKILVLLIFTAEAHDIAKSRNRRGFNIHKYEKVINCLTGGDAKDYDGYGCWCHTHGVGKPVDCVDRCCQKHEACYQRVKNSGCKLWNSPSLVNYNEKCIWGRVACTDADHSSCEYKTCQCDTDAARCFKKSNYNEAFRNYTQINCSPSQP